MVEQLETPDLVGVCLLRAFLTDDTSEILAGSVFSSLRNPVLAYFEVSYIAQLSNLAGGEWAAGQINASCDFLQLQRWVS